MKILSVSLILLLLSWLRTSCSLHCRTPNPLGNAAHLFSPGLAAGVGGASRVLTHVSFSLLHTVSLDRYNHIHCTYIQSDYITRCLFSQRRLASAPSKDTALCKSMRKLCLTHFTLLGAANKDPRSI